jgi:hypothetical protein
MRNSCNEKKKNKKQKTKILIFGGISKFPWLIAFGQILLHWQWLRACSDFG